MQDSLLNNGRLPGWQFVSQGHCAAEHLLYIQLALDAGCRWIQLRVKEMDEAEIIRAGRLTRQLCQKYNARFILNDYVHLVKPTGAAGVHLGLEDMRVTAARRQLGADYMIGGTANTGVQVAARIAERVDYIGLGPYRFTRTKRQLSPLLGVEGYRKILGEKPYGPLAALPVYAIGGIGPGDLPLLGAINLTGVAVSGWLTRQVDFAGWFRQMEKDRQAVGVDESLAAYQSWKQEHPVEYSRVIVAVRSFEAALVCFKPPV